MEILPVDHESNRLGTKIHEFPAGAIYLYTWGANNSYYIAWPANDRRGFRFKTLEHAATFLGITRPFGYADFEGRVRLGKFVERGAEGEIWKYADGEKIEYYIWSGGIALTKVTTLTLARAVAKVNTRTAKPVVRTAPKSSYAQNQKGYRAGTGGRK